MHNFIFATNNLHKLGEIKKVCPSNITIKGLKESGITIDIAEPFDTLRENAFIKCKTIYELTNKNCFSEDTGLEIDALNGAPGVNTARFAGDHKSDSDNIQKVLNLLKGVQNRKSLFRTIICLCINGLYHYFEGICEGNIAEKAYGTNGFGYDPIFIPQPYKYTFAELDNSLKINISHRKKAFDNLYLFLQQLEK